MGNEKSNNYVAIMAGGIGSRFWPESRVNKPKQYLDILDTGKSLIQMTYDRFLDLCPKENIFIVTNEMYVDITAEQLPDLKPEQILAEPARRNTAPCIAYVCHKIEALNPNANIIVAPSDHLIMDEQGFTDVMQKAVDFVSDKDVLVTLGIKPRRPDTGYGYIQYIDKENADGVYKVKTFTEKPDLELAKTFLESGDFLWNSGMFIWNVRSILKAFKKYQQEIYDVFAEGADKYNTPEEKEFIDRAYPLCTNISIDFAIMEKAGNVSVIPSDFGWSDLGTWASLYEHHEKDYLGNAVAGENVMVYDTQNSIIMAPKDKLVVVQGLDDYVVIDTDGVLLIWKKSEEQDIKGVTADVRSKKGPDFL